MFKHTAIVFCSLVITLSACAPEPKEHFSLTPGATLHIPQVGDENIFAVIDLATENFDSVRYEWSTDTNVVDIPALPADTLYFIESNSFSTQNPGFMRSRFIGPSENGDWLLYGFTLKSGKRYWLKYSGSNTYGITYLSLAPATDSTPVEELADIMLCENLSCTNTGTISWRLTHQITEETETNLAYFESYRLLRETSISLSSAHDTVSKAFYEILWVFPEIGVVRRYLDIPQDFESDRIELDMRLKQTNIVFEENAQQTQ